MTPASFVFQAQGPEGCRLLAETYTITGPMVCALIVSVVATALLTVIGIEVHRRGDRVFVDLL